MSVICCPRFLVDRLIATSAASPRAAGLPGSGLNTESSPAFIDLFRSFISKCTETMKLNLHIRVLLAGLTFLCTASAGAGPSVTAGGRAAYEHVISLPPGRGASPAVTLSYTGGSDSLLGYGWALQAGGSIHRCAGQKTLDGKQVPVRHLSTDRLCLDGERLIQVDPVGSPLVGPNSTDALGLSGASFREYRLHAQPTVRVRAYESAGSVDAGPRYFKVWDRSGAVSVYGEEPPGDTNNSTLMRHTASSMNGMVLRWSLARRTDSNGAVQRYFYDAYTRQVATTLYGLASPSSIGTESVLREIQYGPNIKVRFEYIARAANNLGDESDAVTYGHLETLTLVLDRITSYLGAAGLAKGDLTGAVAIRTSKLTYVRAPGSSRPLLASIKTCAGDGTTDKCLPEGEFTYTPSLGGNFTASTALNLPVAMYKSTETGGTVNGALKSYVWSADFDGDGRTDLLRSVITGYNCQGALPCVETGYTSLFRSTGDGAFVEVPLPGMGPLHEVIIADFDGDGRPDILNKPSEMLINYGLAAITLFKNIGVGFAPLPVTGVTLKNTKLELTLYEEPNPPEPGYGGPPPILTPYLWEEAEQFFLLDVNDDGKLDIVTSRAPAYRSPYTASGTLDSLCANIVCTRVYLGDGNGRFTEINTNITHRSLIDSGESKFGGKNILDKDGDGLPDIVRAQSEVPNDPAIFISNGDGTFTVSPASVATASVGSLGRADINGRGQDFYVNFDPRYPSGAGLSGHSTSNNIQTPGYSAVFPAYSGAPSNFGHLLSTADFDNDGRDDFLIGRYNIIWGPSGGPTDEFFYQQYVGLQLVLSRGVGRTELMQTNLSPAMLGLSSPVAQKQMSIFGNFTGAGVEILTLGDYSVGGPANTLFTRSSGVPADLLLTVKSGLEGTYTFQYGSAVQSGRVAADPGSVADSVSVPPAGYVVTSLTSPSAVPGVGRVTEYSYSGMRKSTKGYGMLGYAESREQSLGADGSPLTKVSRWSQVHPYIGVQESESLYMASLFAISDSNKIKDKRIVTCDAAHPQAAIDAAVAARRNCPDPNVTFRRSFEVLNSTTGKELDGTDLPAKLIRSAVNSAGYLTSRSETTQDAQGTYVATTVLSYAPDDVSCASATECRQWLERVSRRVESRSVPGVIQSTSGGRPSAIQPGATPPPVSQQALNVMLMLLLDD